MALIIVIEDNALISRLAEKLLTRAGHQVVVAETGEDGLTAIFEYLPQLVLMDLGLPDIDGQTVIGLLHQQAAHKTTPVIAFTAWPAETAYKMAKAYGCDGVITKPINTRTFAAEVETFMQPKPVLAGTPHIPDDLKLQ
ncbi:MAG: response regulator [Chloroflexota bacterium]